MSAQNNKAIAFRALEIFSRGDLDALDQVIDRNFVDHHPQPDQGPGLEGLRQTIGSLREAFPDIQWAPEEAIAEGDKVAVRMTISGTHRGAYKRIPATGQHISIPMIDIVRIADGKVVERWGVEDQLALLQQLAGAAPKGLAKLGKAALAVALPAAMVWAWRNDKLPELWSQAGQE